MPISIVRGNSDETIEQIIDALKGYETANGQAQIDVYRQSPVSVRIRVVDPSLRGLDKPGRHSKVWHYLQRLPEVVQGDISMLLLLAPEERNMSFANFEFDDPVASSL
jgi:hypothetical protein